MCYIRRFDKIRNYCVSLYIISRDSCSSFHELIPSFQLGTVTLASWRHVSVRAINRSAFGFPNVLVFCCVRAGYAGPRAYAPTSAIVRRPSSVCLSVRPSVNILRKSLLPDKWLDHHQTCTRWSPYRPASRVCSRLRSKFNENRFSQADGWIATKLVHDGSQPCLHPGCAQGQGRGQRSRDMSTSVMS